MAGGHGGARPGAGRKKGGLANSPAVKADILESARAKHSTIINDEIINSYTPAEVLLLGMKLALQEGDWDKAVARASLVAPYMHSRLSSQEVTTTEKKLGEEKTVEERAANVFGVDFTQRKRD